MSSMLQAVGNCKYFLIINLVVYFSKKQFTRMEGNRVKFLIERLGKNAI
jgi:hypothetical protein